MDKATANKIFNKLKAKISLMAYSAFLLCEDIVRWCISVLFIIFSFISKQAFVKRWIDWIDRKFVLKDKNKK